MIDLSTKSVLVTGGSRGIGAAIVRAVGAAGARVVIHYRADEDAATQLRDEVGADRCAILQADLADPTEVERLWSEALTLAPELDVLINNAGIAEFLTIETPLAEWRAAWARSLQVNLQAPADLCRAAILHFRKTGGGKIINVSSRAAFRGESAELIPYGATKGALVTLTKSIAREFAADGVLAFGIAPGFAATDMVNDNMDDAAIAAATATIPLGEMAPPGEIGALAAFLCDDTVRHLTGATFDINGASYLR